MEKFHQIMSRYYKIQRGLSEDCIGDILKIISESMGTSEDREDRIIDRIKQHYLRGEIPALPSEERS